jgi:ribosome-associated protein
VRRIIVPPPGFCPDVGARLARAFGFASRDHIKVRGDAGCESEAARSPGRCDRMRARYNDVMTRKTRITPIEPADAGLGDDGLDARPSKSQLKREMHALQVLGTALVELPKDALKRMPMPEGLADAVHAARSITDHEGKRRQMQYIGRVMRTLADEETAALRTALEVHRGVNKAETARLHWIEHARERLLADDDAFTAFVREHPAADAQAGRTLIRHARKEAQQGRPPRYFRELYQWIKTASTSNAVRADHADSESAATEDDDDDTQP